MFFRFRGREGGVCRGIVFLSGDDLCDQQVFGAGNRVIFCLQRILFQAERTTEKIVTALVEFCICQRYIIIQVRIGQLPIGKPDFRLCLIKERKNMSDL